MTLAHIAPRHRPLLRWQGWLLAAWVLATGWGASWALLHGARITAPWLRWPLAMLALYALGIVGGGWCFVRWWLAQPQPEGRPEHAAEAERLAYALEQDTRAARLRGWTDSFDWAQLLADLGELFTPLYAIAALLALVGLAGLAGWLPLALTESLGGFVAELLLEFVIGAVIVRRVLRPRPMEEYAASIVRRTGWMGVLAVGLAAVAGGVASWADPSAVTLLQALHGPH